MDEGAPMGDEARDDAFGGAACRALFPGCGSDARCHPHCESEDEPVIAPQPEKGESRKTGQKRLQGSQNG